MPACALDAERVRAGADPDVRQVMVGAQRMPYWQGGPAYAPYAAGYFGGGMSLLFAGLLIGGGWAAGGPATTATTVAATPAVTAATAVATPGRRGRRHGGGDFGGGDFGGGTSAAATSGLLSPPPRPTRQRGASWAAWRNTTRPLTESLSMVSGSDTA